MLNLLSEANDSKFVTRNWNIVYNQSYTNYSVGNEIIYITEVIMKQLILMLLLQIMKFNLSSIRLNY